VGLSLLEAKTLRLNLKAATDAPEEIIWKWNECNNPDFEEPIYRAYDKDVSAKIEESF